MAAQADSENLLYAILLAPDERAALLRALRCVEENWTLDPAELRILVRLEALEGGGIPALRER